MRVIHILKNMIERIEARWGIFLRTKCYGKRYTLDVLSGSKESDDKTLETLD